MLPSSPALSCFFFLPPELPRKKKANKEQFPLVEQQQKNVISSSLRLLEQQGWSFRGRSSWRCVLYYGAPLSISTDSPLLLAQCRKWRHSTKRLHPLQFLLTWFLRQTPPPPLHHHHYHHHHLSPHFTAASCHSPLFSLSPFFNILT